MTNVSKDGKKKLSVCNFYAVTKRTINGQQTKNQLNFARKRFRSRKAIIWSSKYVLLHHL